MLLCSYFSFFTALSFMGSGVSYQPVPPLPPPSVSALPLYGTPPPPTEPVYEAPPPPIGPSCEPPPPTEPVYEAPPPPPPIGPLCEPPPPSPSGPLYGVPLPPSPPGNCQPSVQNCVHPPPNADIYQHIDSASDMPLYCLHILALMSLIFLPWLIC